MVSDKELIEGMIRTVNDLKKFRNDETMQVVYYSLKCASLYKQS